MTMHNDNDQVMAIAQQTFLARRAKKHIYSMNNFITLTHDITVFLEQ